MSLKYDKFQSEFNVSRETIDSLKQYHDLLILWAKRINLISLNTIDEIWERHFANSARFLSYFEDKLPQSIIDFGSGAGFPGLIIAALLKDKELSPNIKLVDENHKRIAFLREASRLLGVKVELENSKIENVIPQKYEVVTARAFAPLDKLLNYSHPYAQLGARLVFLKGIDVDTEIETAKLNWKFNNTIKHFNNESCIIEISELENVAR